MSLATLPTFKPGLSVALNMAESTVRADGALGCRVLWVLTVGKPLEGACR